MGCCGKKRKEFQDQVAATKTALPPNILAPIPVRSPKPLIPPTPQPQLSPRELRVQLRGQRILTRLARIAARQARAAKMKASIEEASKKNQVPPIAST